MNYTIAFIVPTAVCNLKYLSTVRDGETYVVAVNHRGQEAFRIRIQQDNSDRSIDSGLNSTSRTSLAFKSRDSHARRSTFKVKIDDDTQMQEVVEVSESDDDFTEDDRSNDEQSKLQTSRYTHDHPETNDLFVSEY